jgi:hypothetical protein
MDYTDNEDDQEGVTKWPFYLAALFIVTLVLGFAYLHLKVSETLDQWQLTTCILASGLASILVFIPHLIDRFLAIAFDPAKRKDEELHRKTYFDIKEMRSELEAFSVKVDKVPTLVDKIVSEALAKESKIDPTLNQIPKNLEEIKNSLIQKITNLEELIVQTPLLPESNPALDQAIQSIPALQKAVDTLSSEIKDLHKIVGKIPTEFPKPVIIEKEVDTTFSIDEEIQETKQVDENQPSSMDLENSFPESEEETSLEDSNKELVSREEKQISATEETNETELDQSEDSTDQASPTTSENKKEDLESDEESIIPADEDNEIEEEESENNPGTVEEEIENLNEKTDGLGEIDNQSEKTEPQEIESQEDAYDNELDLDLPDPEETIRKVDAILQETDPNNFSTPLPDKEEPIKPKISQTGTTSVVANVMIGIGNKPYLRGEGPGLNWDEGVPMNFIEIGKWAWSPPRKNASLTVQLYRNDNDPDKSGKIQIKAGEKIEITPDFS